MRTSHRLINGLLALSALVVLSASALAADPGIVAPAASSVSDQKAGSVLFYVAYASNATAPATENTRLNITNTSQTSAAFIHLYFVDGSTCSVADSFICLTVNQTASVLTSDIDPGVRGYIIAIAVDGVLGAPTQHNFLIGDAYIKYATGHTANLAAEAFAKITAGPAVADPAAGAVTLLFNDVEYNSAPFVLASSSIPSRTDGNDTLLIIDRFGGDLLSTANFIGNIFGILYDDAENAFSYTFVSTACQFRSSFSNSFPRSVPRFEVAVPAGRTGWTKFWSTNGFALLGAQINFNPNASANNPLHPGDFSGGRNLHKLTFTTTATYRVPIFAPSC
jgi:hypothetical protein